MSTREFARSRRDGLPRRILATGLLGLALLVATPLAAQETAPAPRAAVIPIVGPIDDILRDSIDRRLEDARDKGVTVVIFELDTPGGLVTSALDICRRIKGLGDDMRTVAWVNPNAYSAGAMISVACDEIWMSPASAIGDCAPIMVVPGGGMEEVGGAERAKIESPILQEFRDSAARNGYDPLLSRAMVTVGEEVWWIEPVEGVEGERRFVDTAEKERLIDDVEEPDTPQWQLVERYAIPGRDDPIPVKQPVDSADELLTMSQYDAVAFGFARGIVPDMTALSENLGVSGIPVVLKQSGWEIFATWLNSPLVRGLLLVIFLVAGYLEMQSPGLIVPGAIALIALAIFLAAPYAAGLATIWPLLLLALGLILLAVEILVIPGFGVAGILGMVAILAAILATFVPPTLPDVPTFSPVNLHPIWEGLKTAAKVLTGSLVVSVAGIVMLAHYLPKSKIAAGVLLSSGQRVSMPVPEQPDVAQVGDVGVVTGDLRPGGQARFGQELVDVNCPGEYVEVGRRVQVVRRDGLHVFVRPLPDETGAS
jgi:membrane-bound serine protease (ClpP class)